MLLHFVLVTHSFCYSFNVLLSFGQMRGIFNLKTTVYRYHTIHTLNAFCSVKEKHIQQKFQYSIKQKDVVTKQNREIAFYMLLLLFLIPTAVVDGFSRAGFFRQLLSDHRPRSTRMEVVRLGFFFSPQFQWSHIQKNSAQLSQHQSTHTNQDCRIHRFNVFVIRVDMSLLK